MESNETIKLTTVNGHAVELRPFITGKQKRYIENAYTEDIEVQNVGGTQSFNVKANKAIVAQDRAIESVVVSIDAKTENVVELLLALPSEDSDQVLAQIEDLMKDKKNASSTPKTSAGS